MDYDKDYVEISWRPPKNDGGAPIEKYIVEKKEKGSDKWEKVRPYHNFSALTLVCSLLIGIFLSFIIKNFCFCPVNIWPDVFTGPALFNG